MPIVSGVLDTAFRRLAADCDAMLVECFGWPPSAADGGTAPCRRAEAVLACVATGRVVGAGLDRHPYPAEASRASERLRRDPQRAQRPCRPVSALSTTAIRKSTPVSSRRSHGGRSQLSRRIFNGCVKTNYRLWAADGAVISATRAVSI